MLKNAVKYGLTLSALSCVIPAFADSSYFYDSSQYPEETAEQIMQQKEQEAAQEKARFARTGNDYYVYAGYLYSYHFNDKNTLLILGSDLFTQANISPKDNLPNTFNSVEVGFGKQWSKHLDFQIAYVQQFNKSKNSQIAVVASPLVPGTATIRKKGLSFDFLYIFNPDDRFQVGAELGVEVMHISDTIVANSITYQLPDDNTTEIDPTSGLELVFEMTPSLALRVNGQYAWHTQSKVSSGEVNAFVGLSYII